MALFNINNQEPREFKYKPRFYTPEEEKPTGDHRKDFAEELRREWSSKRRHTDDKKNTPWLTIMTMLFFVLIIAILYFKFFK